MYIQSVIETHEQSLREMDILKTRPGGNLIFNSLSKLCSWPAHADRFSLKFAFQGPEYYWLTKNKIAVKDHQFLVVNAGQSYSSMIRSSEWVNSFALYIDPVFFSDVVTAFVTSESWLVDNPFLKPQQTVWFYDQVLSADQELWQLVHYFKVALESQPLTAFSQEEFLHQILAALLQTYQTRITQKAAALSSVKVSTRLELCRRLYLAREFIDDQAAADISLDDIARTAMLSKNHLLRHFKALFGLSPHQHLVNRRLERARERLRHSKLPVHQIALDQGFDVLSTFNRCFKARFSISPSQYRQQILNR